jgi:hypothetical protein
MLYQRDHTRPTPINTPSQQNTSISTQYNCTEMMLIVSILAVGDHVFADAIREQLCVI